MRSGADLFEFLRRPFDGETELSSEEGAFSSKWLYAVLAGWFLIWFLIPVLVLRNDYIDVFECVIWSRNLQFGYDRNPYFVGWFSRLALSLSGGSLWIFHFLCPAFVVCSSLCLWTLARRISLSKPRALIAAILPLLLIFQGLRSLEFNDDVMEIGLWALSILFYHSALSKGRLSSWLLTGLFCGLSFMTKYYGLALFAPMGVLALATPEGRAAFKKPGIYLAGLLFVLLSAPNIFWLWRNDFITVFYSLNRASLGCGWSGLMTHFVSPASCFFSVCSYLLAPLLVFFLLFHRRSLSEGAMASSFDKVFVALVCWGPILVTLGFSAATGGEIKGSWLTPVFSPIGLFLVVFWRPFVSKIRLAALVVCVCLFGVGCASLFLCKELVSNTCLKKNCPYQSFPGRAVAADLTGRWRAAFGAPLKYVIGFREEACNVSVFSKDSPRVFFEAKREFSPWIDRADVARHGALILWKGVADDPPPWFSRLKDFKDAGMMEGPWQVAPARAAWEPVVSLFGFKPKPVPIAYMFLKPAKSAP